MTAREISLIQADLAQLRGCPLPSNSQLGSRDSELWQKAQDQILAIARLDSGWEGASASPIHAPQIRSALMLMQHLKKNGEYAPHDIYLLPDGNIMLEWQSPDDIIRRIEVEGDGCGQEMISYPDAEATFKNLEWPPIPRTIAYVTGYQVASGADDCLTADLGDVQMTVDNVQADCSDPEFSLAA